MFDCVSVLLYVRVCVLCKTGSEFSVSVAERCDDTKFQEIQTFFFMPVETCMKALCNVITKLALSSLAFLYAVGALSIFKFPSGVFVQSVH